MAVSKDDVDSWIRTAIEQKCEFIISVCDTFEWDDYPVYCKDKNDLIMTYERFDGVDMQKINEIIQIIDGHAIENLNIETII